MLAADVHQDDGDVVGSPGIQCLLQQVVGRASGREAESEGLRGVRVVDHARAKVPAEREGFPFAPVVEVADDAPSYDRLVGWYGRDPHWSTAVPA